MKNPCKKAIIKNGEIMGWEKYSPIKISKEEWLRLFGEKEKRIAIRKFNFSSLTQSGSETELDDVGDSDVIFEVRSGGRHGWHWYIDIL